MVTSSPVLGLDPACFKLNIEFHCIGSAECPSPTCLPVETSPEKFHSALWQLSPGEEGAAPVTKGSFSHCQRTSSHFLSQIPHLKPLHLSTA